MVTESHHPHIYKDFHIVFFDKSSFYDPENIIQSNLFLKEITVDICRQGPTDSQFMKIKDSSHLPKTPKIKNQSLIEMPENISDGLIGVLFTAGHLNNTDAHIQVTLLTHTPTSAPMPLPCMLVDDSTLIPSPPPKKQKSDCRGRKLRRQAFNNTWS